AFFNLSNSPGDSQQPSVAVGPDRHIYVSWLESVSGVGVEYDPSRNFWGVFGGSGSGQSQISFCGAQPCYVPRVDATGGQRAALTWVDSSGYLYAGYAGVGGYGAFNNGSTVTSTPLVSAGNTGAHSYSLAWPGDFTLPGYVAFEAPYAPSTTVYLRQVTSSGASSYPASYATDSGTGMPGFSGGATPASWPVVRAIPNAPTVPSYLQGQPVLAYHQGTGGRGDVHVLYYDTSRSVWTGFNGQDVPTAGQVNVGSVAMAIDSKGSPIIAYEAGSSTNPQIYVKRFDPSAGTWVGLSGSDAGPGVSNATFSATAPAIAVGVSPLSAGTHGSTNEVVCVAWVDLASGASGATPFLRCHWLP
ncbi:MAG TPA: hypothetical protein VFH51_00315, partial [Myxococcota bacterium]|nr:hypothetical protein [Myxococcota bacterium]